MYTCERMRKEGRKEGVSQCVRLESGERERGGGEREREKGTEIERERDRDR